VPAGATGAGRSVYFRVSIPGTSGVSATVSRLVRAVVS
jgi:hypothetical protein